MKTVITTLSVVFLLMAGACKASVQELSESMEAFKQICLDMRSAIDELDGNELRACKERLHKFYYDFGIGELTLCSIEDGKSDIPLDGHVVFEESYIDFLINDNMDFAIINYDAHSSVRGSEVKVRHKLIPANGEASYKYLGCDDMELVVVTEEEVDFKLTVNSNGETVNVEPTAKGLFEYKWQMPDYPSDVVITLENPVDRDISCIIISN